MWLMLKDEKLYRDSDRKTNGKWDARETGHDSGLYHKVNMSSRKECDLSSMWWIVKVCSNNRKNDCRRVSLVIQR